MNRLLSFPPPLLPRFVRNSVITVLIVVSICSSASAAGLYVTLDGAGGGFVTSDPPGISCPIANCSADFPDGSPVSLIPTPNSTSTFSGWSNACTNTTGNCSVTMDITKTASAHFTAAPKARIAATGTGYPTLGAAYSAANSGDTIMALDSVMPDTSLNIDAAMAQGKSVTIKGGYTADYSGRSLLPTSVHGPLSISSGSLEVDGLAIIPNDNAGTFDITATSGAHGTVTPGGVTTLSLGASQTYTITPNTGYTIATLTVDGNSITPAASYLFSNVQADHTISAIFSADTTAPSVPADLSASAISATQVNLTWTASTDDTAVTGYRVYRNGTQVATSVTNSYSDSGLTASTQYAYTVAAYDAAGNVSAHCVAVNVTTQAATGLIYYVSPSSVSTDWSAAKNISTPCTVQTAFNNAVAGDTVQFRGGFYKVPAKNFSNLMHGYYEPSHSGLINNPIVFMAYPEEIPVFDGTIGGSGDKDGQGYYNCATIFSTNNKSYITFDGFTFQSDGGTRMAKVVVGIGYPDATGDGHIIVKNCIFNGGTNIISDSTDNNEGLRIEGAVDVVVQNNIFYNYRHISNWHNTSAIKTYHNTAVVIENCEFYNTSLAVFLKSSTNDSIIRYCFIHDNFGGIMITPDIHPSMDTDNLTVCHNVIVNNAYLGYQHTGPGSDAFTHGNDFLLYNNTFYNNGTGSSQSGNVGLGYTESGHGYSFYNNISIAGKGTGLITWDRSNWRNYLKAVDHNQWGDVFKPLVIGANYRNITIPSLAAWQSSGQLENPIDVGGGSSTNPGYGDLANNPLFVNASGDMNKIADFALQSGSPCKGAGRSGIDIGADVSLVGVQENI